MFVLLIGILKCGLIQRKDALLCPTTNDREILHLPWVPARPRYCLTRLHFPLHGAQLAPNTCLNQFVFLFSLRANVRERKEINMQGRELPIVPWMQYRDAYFENENYLVQIGFWFCWKQTSLRQNDQGKRAGQWKPRLLENAFI